MVSPIFLTRQAQILSSSLENPDSGLRNFVSCRGIQNTLFNSPNSNKSTKCTTLKSNSTQFSGEGSARAFGKGCSLQIMPFRRGISKQYLFGPKKGRGSAPSDQFEGLEQVCSLRTFQNGRFGLFEVPSAKGRLHVQDRFEGCLFQCSLTQIISQICQVSLVRQYLHIPLPVFRVRTSPTNLYQTVKGTYSPSEKAEYKSNYLSGRYVNSGVLYSRNKDSKGHCNLPSAAFGFCDQLEKIDHSTNSANRDLGSESEFIRYDFVIDKGENIKGNCTLSENVQSHGDNSVRADKADRFVVIHHSSSTVCKATISSSSTTTNLESKSNKILLFQGSIKKTSSAGVKVVDGEFKNLQWEKSCPALLTSSLSNRCLKERMGWSLQGDKNWRSVVTEGAGLSHQPFRSSSSKTSNFNIHKNVQGVILSPTSGQQSGIVIPSEDGGHNFMGNVQFGKRNMGVFTALGDHTYCRVSSQFTKCISRLGISKHQGQLRMETLPKCLQKGVSNIWSTSDRSLCKPSVTPSPEVLFLETRPIQSRDRCNATGLVRTTSVCISPLLTPQQSTQENRARKSEGSNPGNTNMAKSIVVPKTSAVVNETPLAHTSKQKSSKKPIQSTTSFGSKQNVTSRCLDGYRSRLAQEGVSERATNLIASSRRDSSNSSYSSAWNKWASWCDRRQISPFQCHVNVILDYLASMFEEGYLYNTICFHRSAISAFHEGFEGKPIGEHPRISSLVTGVFNQRPPQPRFNIVWDVQVVLDYLKKISVKSKELSDKYLTLKTTMLIALTSASRSLGIHHLDIRFMQISDSQIIFTYSKLHKSWKKGSKPPSLSFTEFPEDEDLCVVKTLKTYLARSGQWRQNGQPTQLLLSHIKPHIAVSSDTIARWIKTILKEAGINTQVFTAHSTRSASTSKAHSQGATLEEILARGSWSSKSSTWQRHYRKDVTQVNRDVENFQNRVYTKNALN